MKAALIFTDNNGPQNANSGNTAFMIREMNMLGYTVDIHQIELGDPNKFFLVLSTYLQTYPLCMIIGGLGTNYNPNAKEIIAKSFNLNLLPHSESAQKLQRIYMRKGQNATSNDLRYVTIPVGAHPIVDENYAIPGFVLEHQNGSLIVLPDNDDVFIDMYVKHIFPYLANLNNKRLIRKIINIYGLSNNQAQNILKSEVMAREALISLFGKSTGARYVSISSVADGYTPVEAGVVILEHNIKNKLGSLVSDENIQMLPANIVRLFEEYDLTLSIAESITDGSIAKNIKSVPGGDQVVETSISSLINDVKHKEMNIPKDILRDFPDASEHMAMCMAAGVLENGVADISLAVSGGMISDNRGGFNSTGFVALATEQGVLVKKVDLIGLAMSRSQIEAILTISALDMLYVFLKQLPDSVHNLFELKTLRQRDLDKTIENIRKKEEIILQREMEDVTVANQMLMNFRGTFPERLPPTIVQRQNPPPIDVKMEQNKPPIAEKPQKQDVSPPKTEQTVYTNDTLDIETDGYNENIDTEDGAIPMDNNNNNNFSGQGQPPQQDPWNTPQQQPNTPFPNQPQQPPQQDPWNTPQQQPNTPFPNQPQQQQQQDPWGASSQQNTPFSNQPQQQQQDPWGANQQQNTPFPNQQPQQPQQPQQDSWDANQQQNSPFSNQQPQQQQDSWGASQQQNTPFPNQQPQQQQDPWGASQQNTPFPNQPQQPQQDPWGASQQQNSPFSNQQPQQQQDPWGANQQQNSPFSNQPQQQQQQDPWGASSQPNSPFSSQGQFDQNSNYQFGSDQSYQNQSQNNLNGKKNLIDNNEEEENLTLFAEIKLIFLPNANDSTGKKILKILLLIGILALAIGLGYVAYMLTLQTYNGAIWFNMFNNLFKLF